MNKSEARRQPCTDKLWQTSRQVVVGTALAKRGQGWAGRSQPSSPFPAYARLPPPLPAGGAAKKTDADYGRTRLSHLLWQQQLAFPPNTIHHILKRHGLEQPRCPRKICSPAQWAWESEALSPGRTSRHPQPGLR